MSFHYHRSATPREALEMAAHYGCTARYLAGGTDLVIHMRRGKLAPGHLIDIRPLSELGAIAVGRTVEIGALATHASVEHHPAFQGRLRALVDSARVVGGPQIRNMGTVGGNIANASPAADVVPVLMALDARVNCLSAAGPRSLPLDGLMLGPGRTGLAPGELLTGIAFAMPPEGVAVSFLKAGRRRAMEIASVNIAVRAGLDGDGRLSDLRVVLGAVAPCAVRATAAEAMLLNERPGDDLLRAAACEAARACAPIDDVRASAAYRRHLVERLLPRVVRAALASAQAGGPR